MISLIHYTGVNTWFWLRSFISPLVLVLNTLWPIVIAPCFNTFTPLEEGPVRAGIEKLVKEPG
jgi:STE24 endopeptidase